MLPKSVVAAVGLALVLGGCAQQIHPGSAAVFNGSKITMAQVDDTAEYECRVLQQLQVASQPYYNNRATARVEGLRQLVFGVAADDLAREMNIEVPQIVYPKKVADSIHAQIKDTALADELIAAHKADIQRASTVSAIGAEILGTPGVDSDATQEAGSAAVEKYVATAKISVDPRFEPFTMDLTQMPTVISGSLSVLTDESPANASVATTCFQS
jgi:hypothetical protein